MTQPNENQKPKQREVRVEVPIVGSSFSYKVSSSPTYPGQHGALFNIRWIDSAEYKSYAKWRNIIVAVAIVVGFVLVAGLLTVASSELYSANNREAAAFVPPIVFSVYMGSVAVGVRTLYNNKKRIFRDRYVLGLSKEIETEESKVAAQAEGGQLELPSLWAATQTRINYYHEIATTQAEQSFRVGMWAAVAGFVAVIALGVVAAYAPNGTAAIAASVVGVAGAAMSAYVGATFMKTQAQASNQLSKFFLQPVEFARLLGAERLLQTLPESERSEVVSTIVKTMMVAPNSDEDEKKELTS